MSPTLSKHYDLRIFFKSNFVSLNKHLNTVQLLMQLVFDMQKKYKEIRTPRCVYSVDINKARLMTPACQTVFCRNSSIQGQMKDDMKTVSLFQYDNNHYMK